MKMTQWMAIAGGLWLWAVVACSGTTETSGNSEGPGAGSGGESGASDTANSGQAGGTSGTTSPYCPGIEPSIGASCAPEGVQCSFANCMAPDFRDGHTVKCVEGLWALTAEMFCDQEPSDCPALLPMVGYVCDSAATPGPCTTLDACGSAHLAYCSNGAWTFDAPDGAEDRAAPASGGAGSATVASATTGVTTQCPVSAPVIGSPCCPTQVPGMCYYDVSVQAVSTMVGTIGGGAVTGGMVTTGAGGASAGACVTCSADMVWEECQ